MLLTLGVLVIAYRSWFQGETVIAQIENVIGVIEGEEEPDRYIINSEWK